MADKRKLEQEGFAASEIQLQRGIAPNQGKISTRLGASWNAFSADWHINSSIITDWQGCNEFVPHQTAVDIEVEGHCQCWFNDLTTSSVDSRKVLNKMTNWFNFDISSQSAYHSSKRKWQNFRTDWTHSCRFTIGWGGMNGEKGQDAIPLYGNGAATMLRTSPRQNDEERISSIRWTLTRIYASCVGN